MLHAVQVPPGLRPPLTRPLRLDYCLDPADPHTSTADAHWRRLCAEFGHRFAGGYLLGGSSGASHMAGQAVKCAERQGARAGALYLRALQAAVHQPVQPTPTVLSPTAVADRLAARFPALFSAETFHQHWASRAGAAAYRADQQLLHHYQVSRLPGLLVRRGAACHQVAVTSQPYEVLLLELARLAPDVFYLPCLTDGGAG